MRTGIVGVVSVAVVGVGAYAWGAGVASGTKPAQPGRSAQSATVSAATIDSTTESKFTPVTPCRAADTRVHGGPIGSGASRNFVLGGTAGFTTQGGKSGGCGVPLNATGVAITITTVGASHNGFLKVWRTGDPEPGTSFMNYGTAFNSSVAGTVRSSATGQTRIKNFSARSNVIIDVAGYYEAPAFAVVSSGGSLVNGSRVTSAFLITGTPSSYEVDFDRDVSRCAYSVSSYFTGYTLTVEPRSGTPNGVYVFTSFGGTAAADQFYLTVTC